MNTAVLGRLQQVLFKLRKPDWFLMYALSRFSTMRKLITRLYGSAQSKKATNSLFIGIEERVSLFSDLQVITVVNGIKKDGFYGGINLPSATVQDIFQFLETIDYFPDHDGPAYIPPEFEADNTPTAPQYNKLYSRGRYPETFLDCPAIQRIIHDPKLLKIAQDYLGVRPIHNGSRLWWSYANVPPYDIDHAGQRFHYDVDDFGALRFFFYLTKVDSTCGPHMIVRGTHDHKRLTDKITLSRFRSDEDLINSYGQDALVSLEGEAGFGFAEEPQVFHKGAQPTSGDRLILLIRYVMREWDTG